LKCATQGTMMAAILLRTKNKIEISIFFIFIA
jgi:hypothetical protein